MILAYIAGPYTAGTDDEIESNILAAEAVARELIERTDGKVAPIIPHSIGRNFKHGPGDYQYWIAATLEMLKPCDCLVTVPGQERSSGTCGEVEWCLASGTPVFHSVDELISWIGAVTADSADENPLVLSGGAAAIGAVNWDATNWGAPSGLPIPDTSSRVVTREELEELIAACVGEVEAKFAGEWTTGHEEDRIAARKAVGLE